MFDLLDATRICFRNLDKVDMGEKVVGKTSEPET
jgi:hypothetical protein